MFTGVRNAHLFPVFKEKVIVELSRRQSGGVEEVALRNEEGRLEIRFRAGSSFRMVLLNKKTGVRVVVHGGDFTLSEPHQELMACPSRMESCDIKFRGTMGSAQDDALKPL